ncbi:MAG: 50S ribosomal protein L33 [Firmicutes bacterium]|nr:50S ribosomal protein L33 [Bacillota bacterium]
MRKKIILICSVCLHRNYTITKSATTTDRMSISKYCTYCNTHTIHKETK